MITIEDLYNILENKIANEAQKMLIRNNFPPQVADRMCAAIDGHEKAELLSMSIECGMAVLPLKILRQRWLK